MNILYSMLTGTMNILCIACYWEYEHTIYSTYPLLLRINNLLYVQYALYVHYALYVSHTILGVFLYIHSALCIPIQHFQIYCYYTCTSSLRMYYFT